MSKLAINGGTPVRTKPWPRWPVFGEAERAQLLEVFDSGEWGGFPFPQPKTKELGERFATYQDARYGAACANGSISLEICLVAAGIEAGDEVIVPATTWVATGVAPIRVNAVPVFVDVDPTNYCIDCDLVEAAITPRTRAVIPVHLGSSMADLDRLADICRRHNLLLIEDCAHAHGHKWRGRGVGSWGDFGSFSFQSSKILTAGEGGLITTNDEMLHQKVQSLINCGRKDDGYADFPGHLLGYNGRMTEFQAGIMLAQLARNDELIARKEAAVHYLTHQMTAVGGLYAVPRDVRETRRGFYQFIWQYRSQEFKGLSRDRFLAALEAEGVEWDGMFYPPMPFHPLMAASSRQWPMLKERYGEGIQSPETLKNFSFPVGQKFAQEEGIWMHYPYLLAEKSDLSELVEAVAKVKAHVDELL
jgi:dTDP-4-amino-4,6-dideoxygalactose transaminase